MTKIAGKVRLCAANDANLRHPPRLVGDLQKIVDLVFPDHGSSEGAAVDEAVAAHRYEHPEGSRAPAGGRSIQALAPAVGQIRARRSLRPPGCATDRDPSAKADRAWRRDRSSADGGRQVQVR